MRTKILLSVCVASLAIGCGGKDDGGADATTFDTNNTSAETGDSGMTTGPTSADGTSSATTGMTSADTGDTSDSGSPTSGGFIDTPDGGGGVEFECDIWAQDCPEGQKCMPWDNSGGSSWNATKCSPVDPNPAQPGDECTVEGSGVSGVDNCDVAAMCWDVDPETNMGTCVAFCQGSEANPSCDDPNTTCSITNGGALILCLPTCDPLIQDCAEGNACYPLQDVFVCAPDASGEAGVYGDACEYLNVCDPGLFCANADVVPGCQGSQGCCSEFCDFADPNATAGCSGSAGGQECLAYFTEGMAPPGFEDVGVCVIP